MSIAIATSRVQEISALLERSVGAPASDPNAFAAQMQAAVTSSSPSAAPLATTATTAIDGGGDTVYDALIQDAAQKHGLDPALLKGLIRQESDFNPSAGSPAGAQGLTQLMPGTAAALGVSNVMDPAQAIEGGAKYLAEQLKTFGGDQSLALAAYNAGPGAVQRSGGIPPYAETQDYVRKVLGYAAGYRGATA